MKSLALKCCIAFLLFTVNAKAQTPDTSTVDKLIRYILNPIDKTQVTTGILAEYGAPLLDLSTFNGVLTDSNKVNINIFRTLAYQIQTAYCGSGTSSLPAITTVNSSIASLSHDTLPIPVPLLIGNYNSVKTNAFTNNLLYHNTGTNQVEDVSGRSESPYQNNYLFAASPTKNFTVKGKDKFLFSSSLLWNNTGKTISQIQVDFDNTLGYKTITLGTPITVSYADTGTKTWIIKVTFTDASTLQCYSSYYVAKSDISNTAARYQPGTGGVFGGGFDTSVPFTSLTNAHDGARVYIAYTSLNRTNTIRKPLIVVEGFDPYNSYTYMDFIGDINVPRLQYNFNEQLDEEAGYDIIFVDFNNGSDDIRRNAALLEEVITWVNNNKVANTNNPNPTTIEQNVVLGISMGGLVARYALAEMTKNNVNTATRLLLTHDSPHRGANVPLGLQYLIQMAGQTQIFGTGIRDIFPDYDQTLALLETDAAQQMLIYRSTGTNTYANNTFLDGAYRTMITFSPSDPQPTYQFLATSNGSQCGNEIFGPHHQIVSASVGTFVFLFPVISNRIQVAMSAYALPETGQSSLLASLSVSNKTKLFGLITVAKQMYDGTAYASGTQLPIDGVSGGLAPYQMRLGNGSVNINLTGILTGLSDALIFSSIDFSLYGNPTYFTFVLTVSALDAAPFNTASFNQNFVNGTNPSFPSSSNNFIAQETNSGISNVSHTLFTARNANWMFDEMEGIANTRNCSAECNPPYFISGANAVCSTAVFSIPGLENGATVIWSTNYGYVSFSSTTSNPVTVTAIGSGTITLTATISTPCGGSSIVITKSNIQIGGPYTGFTISSYPYADQSCYEVESINSFQATLAYGESGTGYQWGHRVLGVTGDIMYPYNSPYFTLIPDQSGTYEIFVRPTNTCGVGWPESVKTITVAYSCLGGRSMFTASPNPTTGDVLIESIDKKVVIKQIEITDKLGNLKKRIIVGMDSKKTKINIAELPADVYIIRIFDGKNWVSKKVVKN